MNDHCGCSTIQPSDGLSVPTNQPLTKPEPQTIYPAAIVIRAPANMPAAPQPFDPAGLGPDSNQQGDVDTQSTIKPLASSDVGGTAGHDAAACACARGKCDGERVRYARDANCVLSPTTQSLSARQVVGLTPHPVRRWLARWYDPSGYTTRVLAGGGFIFIWLWTEAGSFFLLVGLGWRVVGPFDFWSSVGGVAGVSCMSISAQASKACRCNMEAGSWRRSI